MYHSRQSGTSERWSAWTTSHPTHLQWSERGHAHAATGRDLGCWMSPLHPCYSSSSKGLSFDGQRSPVSSDAPNEIARSGRRLPSSRKLPRPHRSHRGLCSCSRWCWSAVDNHHFWGPRRGRRIGRYGARIWRWEASQASVESARHVLPPRASAGRHCEQTRGRVKELLDSNLPLVNKSST